MTVDVRPKSAGESLAEISARLYKVEQRSASTQPGGAPIDPNPSVNTITIGGIVVGAPASPATGLTLTTAAHMEDIWIDADWDAPADGTAAAYDVELARKVGANYELVQNYRTGSGTSIRMAGLEPQQTYGVRVSAINRIGARSTPLPSSGFQDITTGLDATVPGQVTGVVVTAGFKTAMVTWNEVADRDVKNGTGKYEVVFALDSGFTSGVITLFTTGTVATFSDLATSTTYYAKVRAIDNSGNAGAYSLTASDATGQVATVDISDVAITTDKMANLAVNNSKLAALAVDAAKLADSAVTSTKIANLAVGSAAIAALAVGTAKIDDLAVTTAKIGLLQVTTATISDLAVTNAKIANLAVDNAKIASLDAGKITAGTISADRIAANSLDVNKLTTSTLTSTTITIGASGVLKIGNPPTTGIFINDQGIRLYSGGAVKVSLDVAGTANFEGNINASTITSSTLTSATINSGTITGVTITGATVRTAASGKRISLDAGVIDYINLYTGHVSESLPGNIGVGLTGSNFITELRSPRSSANDFALISMTSVAGGNGSTCLLNLFTSTGASKAYFRLHSTSNAATAFVESAGISEAYFNFARSGTNAAIKLRGSADYANVWFWGGGQEATINVNAGLGAGIHIMNGTSATFQPVQASGFNVALSHSQGKTNIRSEQEAASRLKNLRVVRYNRIHLDRPEEEPAHITRTLEQEEIGFLAEELLEVVPEAVITDAEGKAIAFSVPVLLALVIKTVQELENRTRVGP